MFTPCRMCGRPCRPNRHGCCPTCLIEMHNQSRQRHLQRQEELGVFALAHMFFIVVVLTLFASQGILSYLPVVYDIDGVDVEVRFDCTYDKVSSSFIDDIPAKDSHEVNGRIFSEILIGAQIFWGLIATNLASQIYHAIPKDPCTICYPVFLTLCMLASHISSICVWELQGGCKESLDDFDFLSLRDGFKEKLDFQVGEGIRFLAIVIVLDVICICVICRIMHFQSNQLLRQHRIRQRPVPRGNILEFHGVNNQVHLIGRRFPGRSRPSRIRYVRRRQPSRLQLQAVRARDMPE